MSDGARCGGCGATWTGTGRAHCRGCCQLFATAGLFDRHRSAGGERGRCLDPAGLVNAAGARIMFLRDGMWRGPEMTEAQKSARFGELPVS